jgi:hypothetical protein
MKNLTLFLLASAMLVPAAVAAVPFEGRLTFKMDAARSKAQEMGYAIKGDKIRIEFPSQKEMGGMIVDTSKQEMIMLMDSQRMYTVVPVPGPQGAPAAGGRQPKLEKTGETERIQGYTAEKYISTEGGTKTEFWLTEGLGTFAAFSNADPVGRAGVGGMPSGWERAIAGKPLFPLRVIGYDKAGKQSFRMEVTSINRQALPDGMFTPPIDYQRMDMGGMMRGMMPGRPKR